MPSRTSGAGERRSHQTNAARIPATAASEPSVRAEPQPTRRRLDERVDEQQHPAREPDRARRGRTHAAARCAA